MGKELRIGLWLSAARRCVYHRSQRRTARRLRRSGGRPARATDTAHRHTGTRERGVAEATQTFTTPEPVRQTAR